MRTIVIGGTGHVGTHLIPRLVSAGHEVICVSRGQRDPYLPHAAWQSVHMVISDRHAEETGGTFGQRIADLEPDIVIDMVCFTPDSARHLVEALRGRVQMLLHCGTIWVHGQSAVVPTTEDQPRRAFGEYGVAKAEIEKYLLAVARRDGFPVTVLHPGHIVGQGWMPINPAGNRNPDVFRRLMRGEELTLPNLGLEMLHHVHADDVAGGFMAAIEHWRAAVGESFHIVSPAALTLRGFAEGMAAWYGQPARLRFLPWDQWRETVSAEDAEATWEHIARSPCCSIEKARRTIGYQPRYSSLHAVCESVRWLADQGEL